MVCYDNSRYTHKDGPESATNASPSLTATHVLSTTGGIMASTESSAEVTRWDVGCGPVICLTVRRGPNAGRTLAYCTCGWEHTYRTPSKAARRSTEHTDLASRPGEVS